MLSGREDPMLLIPATYTAMPPGWVKACQKELASTVASVEAALLMDDAKAREKGLTEAGAHLSWHPMPASAELAVRMIQYDCFMGSPLDAKVKKSMVVASVSR